MPRRLGRFLESIPSAGTEYGISFEASSTWALLPPGPAPASETTPHLHQILTAQQVFIASLPARGTWPSTWILSPLSSRPLLLTVTPLALLAAGALQFRCLFLLSRFCRGSDSLADLG